MIDPPLYARLGFQHVIRVLSKQSSSPTEDVAIFLGRSAVSITAYVRGAKKVFRVAAPLALQRLGDTSQLHVAPVGGAPTGSTRMTPLGP